MKKRKKLRVNPRNGSRNHSMQRRPSVVYVGEKDYKGREIVAQSNMQLFGKEHNVLYVYGEEDSIEPFHIERWYNSNGKNDENNCILVINSNHVFAEVFCLAEGKEKKMLIYILASVVKGVVAMGNQMKEWELEEELANNIVKSLFYFMSLPLALK